MMTKKRSFWWLEEWQIGEMQSWFTDMAAQGWHLSKTGKSFAVFSQGEPQQVRYRCDVFPGSELNERLECYRAAGWEYAGSRQLVHIFRAPAAAEVGEIHTDPQEHAYTITMLVRRLVWGCIGMLAVIAWLTLSPLILPNSFWLEVLLKGSLPGVAVIPILLYLIILGGIGVIRTIGQIRQLHQGIPLDNAAPFKRTLFNNKVKGLLAIAAALAILAGQFVGAIALVTAERFPPIPGGTLPVVRMAELMPEAKFTPKATEEGDNGTIFNHYVTAGSFLVPEQWLLQEQGEVVDREWPDSSGTYSPSLQVKAYRARATWVAKALANSLSETQPNWVYVRKNFDRVEYPEFDAMWVEQHGHSIEFIVQRGKTVFQVRYHGLESVDTLLALVIEKMDTLNNP